MLGLACAPLSEEDSSRSRNIGPPGAISMDTPAEGSRFLAPIAEVYQPPLASGASLHLTFYARPPPLLHSEVSSYASAWSVMLQHYSHSSDQTSCLEISLLLGTE